LGVGCAGLRQQFDGNRPVEAIVPGAVDLAHAPAPKHGVDPIWPYVATQH
jgi:hypothetical protein